MRSATALHRLLDVMPVFAGDDRVSRLFTLIPGSEFQIEALAAIERARARVVPWAEACQRSFDLILASSPKGELHLLRGTRVLLPHGAGFNKVLRGRGSALTVSGLDPAYLLTDGRPLVSFHALAHPSQVSRLKALSPEAAGRAAVVGDPTLDRILASRAHRDHYRTVLGTGGRKLIVITSTWGPESLFARRPAVFADLATRLPHDAYQVGAIVHPNERGRAGTFDLSERLAPALDAGMILAGSYEEWAALVIAADAIITDHGSTALYAAALDRPVIGAYDGGTELLAASPMANLLAQSPRLDQPDDLDAAIAAHRPGSGLVIAESAFAEQGHALERLRAELYRLLDLTPPAAATTAQVLPPPAPPARPLSAFAVTTSISGTIVQVRRFPVHTESPAHHIAAEYGQATERQIRSAGLIYHRAGLAAPAPHSEAWTAAGWTARILSAYPGCRTAAVIVAPGLCVTRTRAGTLATVRIEPFEQDGGIVRTDPAAVLSAAHTWLASHPDLPAAITCVIGQRPYQTRLEPAAADEAARAI